MTKQRRPTVLLVHAADELYGADRQLLAIVEAIGGRTKPIVLLPNDPGYRGLLSAKLRDQGVEVIAGPMGVARRRYSNPLGAISWLLSLGRAWIWTVRVARRNQAQLVISNTGAVLVGAVCAATINRPHLWCIREIVDHPTWFRSLVKWLGRLSRAELVAVSRAVASWLEEANGVVPEVIYDGVPLDHEVEPIDEPPTALFVGRLNRWKGHDIFVEVAERVHREVPTSRFVIVGGVVPDDEDAATASREKAHEIDASGVWLQFRGELEDVLPELHKAWVVVAPSIRPDPLPNVVLEAMAAGRPVVGSRIGGIPEMIVHGETGLLVSPGDVGGFAVAVSALLRDRKLAAQMGSAGRRRAQIAFARDVADAQWIRKVASMLGGSPETSGAERPKHRPHAVQWDDRKIARYWDHLARTDESEHFGANYASEVADDIEQFLPRHSLVLDVGCGLGHLIGELSTRGYDVMGIDSSVETLAGARRRLPGLHEGALRCGSMTDLPLPDESVDAIVLSEVIEHTLDDALTPTLNEACRVLRPGGRLIVTTPNSENLERERVQCPSCGARFHRWQHVRRWTPEALRDVLIAHGLTDVRTIERTLRGLDRSSSARLRRISASAMSGHRRRVRCPDCGTLFGRRLAIRLRAAVYRHGRVNPHLLAAATRT